MGLQIDRKCYVLASVQNDSKVAFDTYGILIV